MNKKTLALLAILYFLNAIAVQRTAIEMVTVNFNTRATIQMLLDGTACNPFQQRVLTPWIIKGLRYITPAPIEEAVNHYIVDNGYSEFWQHHMNISPEVGYVGVLQFGVMLFMLCGYGYYVFRLGYAVFPKTPLCAAIAPFIAYSLVTPWWKQVAIYDFSTLCTWAACIYYLYRQKFSLYLVAFALGMLNRETMIYILLPYALYYWDRLPRKQFMTVLAAQIAIAVVVKGMLIWLYSANEGVLMEYYLWRHIFYTFSQPYDKEQLMVAFMTILLTTYSWRTKPTYLKIQFTVICPLFIAFMVASLPWEFRVYLEILPVMSLLMAHSIVEWMGLGEKQLPPPAKA